MRTLSVRQIEVSGDCKHVAIHEFPFPEPGDLGFYRTMISYAAFFEGTKRRNRSDRHLFLVIDLRDGDFRGEWEKARDAALPVIKHDNLISFFNRIGYDRRCKRFTGI